MTTRATLASTETSAAPAAPQKSARNARLDILRGIAVLFVLNFHNFPELIEPRNAGILRFIAVPLQRIGWTGVDLFFVLSGFLVGGLLFHEIKSTGTLRPGRFLIRRGFKIWPAYFVYLAVACTIFHLQGKSAGLAAYNLLHVQNYFGTPFGHTWSLAVEEHFYLALPLLLILLLAVTRKKDPASPSLKFIPIIALLLIFFCTTLRFLNMQNPNIVNHSDQWPTHLRIDSLFFGVTLAYFHHFKPRVLRAFPPALLALFGTALVIPFAIFPFHEHIWIRTIGYTMLYVGYGSILVAFLYSQNTLLEKLTRTLPARGLALVGFFSYSIYLWHNDAGAHDLTAWLAQFMFLDHMPALVWPIITISFIVVAILLGILLGKLIELPALALRNKLFPAAVSTEPVASARPIGPQPE